MISKQRIAITAFVVMVFISQSLLFKAFVGLPKAFFLSKHPLKANTHTHISPPSCVLSCEIT
jgi:hypothetical protein